MANVEKTGTTILKLTAVMDGEIIKIDDVADPIFSEKMIGDGYGLVPSGEKLYSPIDGIIEELASTKHAVYLSTENNIKLLIHIGIDTIELEGKGFESTVESGQSIKKGDLLVSFDPKKIRMFGFDPVVSVVLLDQNDQETDLVVYPDKQAEANKTLAMRAKIYPKKQ